MDGIMICMVVDELKKTLLGFNINKIYQPQNDEIIMNINKKKLLISANPTAARINLTNKTKDNPQNAPMFCMTLRKHIQNARIINISQPNFERIINFEIENVNEFGDSSFYKLIVEIMGKHSNIILIDGKGTIINAIKHVPHSVSSVRQILMHLKYELPPCNNKLNPLEISAEEFYDLIKNLEPKQSLYKLLNGISPTIAQEICYLAGNDKQKFCNVFIELQQKIINNKYDCQIIFDENDKPIILSAIDLKKYDGYKKVKFLSASEAVEAFYAQKSKINLIHQKTSDLAKIISNNISRCQKKIKLQMKALEQTKTQDEQKLFGELIMANIYQIKPASEIFVAQNYYDNTQTEIKLDKNLTAIENAQAYFKKYNRLKRTQIAVNEQLKSSQASLNYLETVLQNLNLCENENDIDEIRNELYQQKILHKKNQSKQTKKTSYLHFVSSDGFDIYIGKNNTQNDFLTLKFAHSNDLWLHTKNIPGSHVIIKTEKKEITQKTLYEAANLCASHSKACNSSNVAVDYTQKKFVKKPSGAKPGMVIYNNYKTVYVTPDKNLIEKLKKDD